jgi:hypothetical protein
MDQDVLRERKLQDLISVGVLAADVPRDVIDEVVAEHGRQARRSDGKLPPHVVVYLVMGLALFRGEDYEEVAARMIEPLTRLGACRSGDPVPTASAITQARKRLGPQVVREVFQRIAVPVADLLTVGAHLGSLRLVSFDGTTLDMPDTRPNAGAYGYPGSSGERAAFPQLRLLTLIEDGPRAPLAAAIAPCHGKGSGERTLLAGLLDHLEEGMLATADAGLFGFDLWCRAEQTGAELLWRVGAGPELPRVRDLGDGSYLALIYAPSVKTAARARLLQAARAGQETDPERARLVRVVEYEVEDRGDTTDRELFCLLTTLTDPATHPAPLLAHTYAERWEHETANKVLKELLDPAGRMLRSKSPELVEQEVFGLLLTQYTLAALMCRAASEAGLDPDRLSPTRTLRIVRRRVADPAAISP